MKNKLFTFITMLTVLTFGSSTTGSNTKIPEIETDTFIVEPFVIEMDSTLIYQVDELEKVILEQQQTLSNYGKIY